jgi:tetratricopeptide (TPR) repeat protein
LIAAACRSVCLLLCAGALAGQASEAMKCDTTAAFSLAKQRLQAKRYDDAVATLDKLKSCDGLSPLDVFEMGWMYGRARHFADALKLFRSVPGDIPDRASHHYAIALSAFELADYRSTIEELKILEVEGLLNAESANLLAVSYSKLGFYVQAEATLAQELGHNRDDLTAYLNLVTLYAEQGRFAEAKQIASDAARTFPNSSAVFVVRGAANTLIGQLDDAYKDFSKAVSLAPDKADPRFFLALTRYKQGKFVDAIDSLESANRLGIADSDLHYLLAECLLRVNGANTQAAKAELDRAIEMNMNSVSARALRGKLLLEAGRTKEAAADLERALRQDPNSRSSAYNLARAYRKLGRTDESRLLVEQLRDQEPDSLGELSQRRLNQVLTRKESQP